MNQEIYWSLSHMQFVVLQYWYSFNPLLQAISALLGLELSAYFFFFEILKPQTKFIA